MCIFCDVLGPVLTESVVVFANAASDSKRDTSSL